MNTHTATELFPSWYNKCVNKDAVSDELTLRKKAIDDMLKVKDKATWLSILKTYLGFSLPNTNDYTVTIDLVKKGDENFDIQNDNLIKVLAGSAIAQLIDQKDSALADLVAIILIATAILPNAAPLLDEHRQRALQFWINKSEAKRRMDLNFKITLPQLKVSAKTDIPGFNQDANTFAPHSEAVLKSNANLHKELSTAYSEINTLNATLHAIKQNLVALSEESNILWWLFGGFSSTLKKPFSKLEPGLLSIIGALGLGILTATLPGIGGVESIISKALSSTEFEVGSTFTIDNIVEKIKDEEEKIKSLFPEEKMEIEFATPLLTALRCRAEYAGNEWKAIYQKKASLKLDTKMGYEHFTHQLYNELMVSRVFETIN